MKRYQWMTLRWHHNERDGISNHWHLNNLLSHLFRSKKISKLHIADLCEGNSAVTGEFPAQRASNVESVSIWWCHHGMGKTVSYLTTTKHIWICTLLEMYSNSYFDRAFSSIKDMTCNFCTIYMIRRLTNKNFLQPNHDGCFITATSSENMLSLWYI